MLIDISLLFRNRNYALLYTGQTASFIGTMMTGVALPWQVYQITHSVVMIGLLSLCQLLPLLFTALLGGVLADRYSRRELLLGAECVLALTCLLLLWNAVRPVPSVSMIFLAGMLMSSLNGLHRPALDSLTQQIVSPADFTVAGALTGLKFSFGAIVAPALAGLLISHAGLFWTYLTDFMTFFVSLCALFMMKKVPALTASSASTLPVWQALKAGLQFATKRQELLGSYFVDFSAMIFGMPNALFPVIAESLGGANVLGLLYSAPAVGALVVSLLSGWTSGVRRYGRAIALAAAGWGVAIIFFGLFFHHLVWALFFLALAGGFDEISAIFRITLWNTFIPHDMRGRLAGIEMISYLSGPHLGDTESSLVASAFGITFSIVSGGVFCVAGVALCCYLFPRFWQQKHVPVAGVP